MNKLETIKRIRWTNTRKARVRWYGVSRSLRLDEKSTTSAVVTGPVDERNWCQLTEEGRHIVNTIIGLTGVSTVWVTPFDLSIELAAVFDWSDIHDEVVNLLNVVLFQGEADVRSLSSQETDPNTPRISWRDTTSDNVRWYGMSANLCAKAKPPFTYEISQIVVRGDDWLSEVGVAVVGAILAMPGVLRVWVKPYSISIEKATVFEWSDYHRRIVTLLNDTLFDGKAEVTQLKTASQA